MAHHKPIKRCTPKKVRGNLFLVDYSTLEIKALANLLSDEERIGLVWGLDEKSSKEVKELLSEITGINAFTELESALQSLTTIEGKARFNAGILCGAVDGSKALHTYLGELRMFPRYTTLGSMAGRLVGESPSFMSEVVRSEKPEEPVNFGIPYTGEPKNGRGVR